MSYFVKAFMDFDRYYYYIKYCIISILSTQNLIKKSNECIFVGFHFTVESWMSCNFLNSSWMQDEDIHYADALFPLIHTRVNDSFVSVSAPDDRAAVLQCCTRSLQGARMQFELWPGAAEGEDIVESCIPPSLLTGYYLVLYHPVDINCVHQCALVCFLPSQMDVDGNISPGLAYQPSALLQISERLAANSSYNHFCCAVQY